MTCRTSVSITRPLLKWAGGKSELLLKILPHFPETYNDFYEPFLGGGSVYLNLKPGTAYLSDLNSDLIHCYRQIQNNPDSVIANLARWDNDSESYYRIRSLTPRSPASRAARILYLTTLSFNGLYRVNLKGQFNVPYGYKTHLNVCDRKRIREFSRVLQPAVFRCLDFERAVSKADRSDLVYFDPPYTVAHENNGFLKYNDKIFSWEDQLRLANLTNRLLSRSCYVFVSNAYHPRIRRLYSHMQPIIVRRPSRIAASSAHRKEVKEYLFVPRSEK